MIYLIYLILIRLREWIWRSRCNVIMDNLFVSTESTTEVIDDYQLTIMGNLRKNKRQVPLTWNWKHISIVFVLQKIQFRCFLPQQKQKCLYSGLGRLDHSRLLIVEDRGKFLKKYWISWNIRKVSYIPTKNKNSFIFSTYNDDTVDNETGKQETKLKVAWTMLTS